MPYSEIPGPAEPDGAADQGYAGTSRTPPQAHSSGLQLFPDPDRDVEVPVQVCQCTCSCNRATPGGEGPGELASAAGDGRMEVRTVSQTSSRGEKGSSKFYRRWDEFSDGTTMHGIKFIFSGSRLTRLAFFLFMLLFVFKLAWQLRESLANYMEYPTSSKITVSNVEGPALVTFPTVSICSHNLVGQSYLDSKPGLDDLFERVERWDAEVASSINFSDPTFAPYADLPYETVLREGGPPDSNVLQCSHFTNDCLGNSSDKYMERELSLRGLCYRINPAGKLMGKGGDYGKLSIKLFSDLDEYSATGKKLAQVGYSVQFHDHEQYSGAIPNSYWLSPGLIYKADLSLTRETRLPPPAGRCNDTLLYNSYGRHEENSCLSQCRDDAIMAKCGCVLVSPPNPHYAPSTNYTPCTLKQWTECGLAAYSNWYQQYVNVSRTEELCYCYPSCREVLYSVSLSSSHLSRFYARDHVQYLPPGYNGTRDVLNNLVVLDILFVNTQELEIEQVLSYGWTNFLGDVGGVLGLFLGASAFTLIEFVLFLGQLFWHYVLCAWRDDHELQIRDL